MLFYAVFSYVVFVKCALAIVLACLRRSDQVRQINVNIYAYNTIRNLPSTIAKLDCISHSYPTNIQQ